MQMFRKLALVAVLGLLPVAAISQTDETAQQREDRGTITAFIEDNLSGAGRQVVLTGFEGALSSRATVKQLTIADEQGIWLTLNDVVLDWSRSSLLLGEVNIAELSAAEIIVDRAPVATAGAPTPEAQGFALPDLPVSVDIQQIKAARVVLGKSLLGQDIEGNVTASLRLSGGDGSATLLIERTDGAATGKVDLKAAYSNRSTELDVDLAAIEGADGIAATLLNLPGRPSIDLVVSGKGPLNDFGATVGLKTDGQDRLAGQITLKGSQDAATLFDVDFSGDLAPLFAPAYGDFFGPKVALAASGQRSATGRTDLSSLTLQARSVQLQGSAQIAPDGLPEKFALQGVLADPDGARVTLPGSGADISVGSANIDIGFDSTAGDSWRGTVVAKALHTPQAEIAQTGLKGSGRISRSADGNRIGGTLNFTTQGAVLADAGLQQALGDSITGLTRFWWQEGSQALNLAGLEITAGSSAIRAGGKIEGLAEGLRISGAATADAQDLARFSTLAGRALSGAGVASIAGSASPLGGEFDLQGSVKGRDLTFAISQLDSLLAGQSQVAFDARRDAGGTNIRSFSIRARQLAADGKGSISSTNADLDFGFAFDDLAALGPGYTGSIRGDASVSGDLVGGGASVVASVDGAKIHIGQAEADRLLQGASKIRLTATYADKAVQIADLNVQAAGLNANAKGRLAEGDSDLSAQIRLADLAALRPEYAGAVQADIGVKGNVQAADITLLATGQGVAIGQAEADRMLAGASKIDLSARWADQALQITALNISTPDLRAEASGLLAKTGSDLKAAIRLASLGAVRPEYSGAISADLAFLGTPENATMQVTGAAQNLRIGQDQADRLLGGNTDLAARLLLKDGIVKIDDFRLDNPALNATAAARITDARSEITLDARLKNLGLLMPEFPGAVTISGTAADDGAGYDLNLALKGPGQIDARISGRVAATMKSADLAITGSAQAGLANPFLGARVVSGPLRADLRLNGPLALASLSGDVTLSNGRYADPSLPFSLQAINTNARLGGGQAQIDVTARASTGGTLSVRGPISLSAGYSADLAAQVTGLVLKDPELFETRANGQITVRGPLTGGAEIAGRIALPETELRIPSTGMGGATDLEGLRHLNESAASRDTRRRAGLIADPNAGKNPAARPFGLNVTISAPNRLFIRGRGLDAELGGEVTVLGTTANVIPAGSFQLIRGRLDILGRRLTLSEASLQMEGSLDPTIRVVASSVSESITSSVVIEGSASDPKVTFASSPELPQEEVLAQLLFGRDLQSLSAFQAIQLANAVASLAGKGGDGIVGKLRQGFGLDDLDVKTAADGSAQLTAGKYISKNLYSEVQVDQAGNSQITLNLDVSKNLTVKGRVGADGNTGIGLFFEKDY